MKILLVGPYPPPHGGVSVHVQNAHRLLTAAGETCRVLNTGGGAGRGERRVRSAGAADLWGRVWRHARAGWTVHVHTNGHNTKSWLLALLCGSAARLGASPVLTLHSGMAPDYLRASRSGRTLARLASPLFGAVVVVNHEIRRALIELGVDPGRIRVLPAFLPAPLEDVELPPDLVRWAGTRRPLLTTALFFRPEYGFDVLLAALDGLRRRHPGIGCIVMGSGEDEADARVEVRRFGLEETVRLAGDVPHAECLQWISRSSTFVRPTRSDGDAISVREALALGVPVVASNVGARPQGVLLFEAGDAEALARRIEVSLGRARNSLSEGPGAELLDLYRDVIERTPRFSIARPGAPVRRQISEP